MKLFYLEWEHNGRKDHRISPFLPSAGHAIWWLSRIKPEVLQCLHSLIVRQHSRSDPR